MGEFHRHLGAAHFCRVDRAGDERNGLAFVDEECGLGFGQLIGVGESACDLPISVEVPLVVLGGEDNGHHFVAQCRFSELIDGDPVGGSRHLSQVGEDLPVRGES